jgi:hypothetical protein
MAASFIPRSDSGLLVWLGNFQNTLPIQAKALAVGPAELKDALDGAKTLSTAIQTDEQKYAEWQAAIARTADLKKQIFPEVQRVIDRLRVAPGFTEEHAKALMAVPPRSSAALLEDHKPAIRGIFSGGRVRVHWTRGALDGINVYCRRKGETDWQLLGRDTRPPYDDPRPLPATPSLELREYRAVGVVDDQEVGHPSDIITVTVSS